MRCTSLMSSPNAQQNHQRQQLSNSAKMLCHNRLQCNTGACAMWKTSNIWASVAALHGLFVCVCLFIRSFVLFVSFIEPTRNQVISLIQCYRIRTPLNTWFLQRTVPVHSIKILGYAPLKNDGWKTLL